MPHSLAVIGVTIDKSDVAIAAAMGSLVIAWFSVLTCMARRSTSGRDRTADETGRTSLPASLARSEGNSGALGHGLKLYGPAQ